MKNREGKNKSLSTFLLGIPIILIGVLAYFFVLNYKPNNQKVPFDTLIYSSDIYSESQTVGWHKISFSSFSMDVPNDYFFYLEEGVHGGVVGGLTDSKDTISFVHGRYYFDACEGIIVGEIVGRCDTLEVIETKSRNLIISRTDSYISAFAKNQKNDHVFKVWANLNIDRDLLFQIFRTISFSYQ